MLRQQNLYDAGGWFISSEVPHLPRAGGDDRPRGVGHRELVERGLRACTADHDDEHHDDHLGQHHHDNLDNHHDDHKHDHNDRCAHHNNDDHNGCSNHNNHGPRDHNDGGSAINHFDPTINDYTGAPNDDNDATYYVHLQFNDDIHDLDHGGPDDHNDDYDDRRPHYDFQPTPNHYSFHNDFAPNDDGASDHGSTDDLDHNDD